MGFEKECAQASQSGKATGYARSYPDVQGGADKKDDKQ